MYKKEREWQNPNRCGCSINDNCGYAIALEDLGTMPWSRKLDDVVGLANVTMSEAKQDFDSCENTQKIIQAGGRESYQAAWAAVDYVPSAAPETKGKWCLPAAGVLEAVDRWNSIIGVGLAEAGGKLLKGEYNNGYWIWSSSVSNYEYAWVLCINKAADWDGVRLYQDKITSGGFTVVRPVLTF